MCFLAYFEYFNGNYFLTDFRRLVHPLFASAATWCHNHTYVIYLLNGDSNIWLLLELLKDVLRYLFYFLRLTCDYWITVKCQGQDLPNDYKGLGFL